jgi:hypothetical protein
MFEILWVVLSYPMSFLRPRHELALGVLALRHPITVLQRQTPRPTLMMRRGSSAGPGVGGGAASVRRA